MDFSTLSIEQLLQARTIPCVCGMEHTLTTQRVLVAPGAIKRLPELLAHCGLCPEAGVTHCAVLSDTHTYAAAGEETLAALRSLGLRADSIRIGGDNLHADERCIGHFLLNLDPAVQFLVAVGAGTLNDSTRFLSHRLHIPYIIVGTAPSMDGYASAVAPIVRGGFKETVTAVAPTAILCDTDVLAAAPQAMLAAGLGDVAGKLVALLDWKLGQIAQGEWYCPELVALMRRAVKQTLASAPGIAARDPQAVAELTEALIYSGLAMQMAGNSRPASGSEHHLSHFWEMQSLDRGKPVSLHGDKVGVGTLLMMEAYGRFFAPETPPETRFVPTPGYEAALRACLGAGADNLLAARDLRALVPPETACARIGAQWQALRAEALALAALRGELAETIRQAGGPVTVQGVGVSGEDALHAFRYARNVRYERYTLLSLLDDFGQLETIARSVVDAHG